LSEQGAATAVPYAAVASVWAWVVTALEVRYNTPLPATTDGVTSVATSPVTEDVAGALPTEPLMVVLESVLVTPEEASTPNGAAVSKLGVVAYALRAATRKIANKPLCILILIYIPLHTVS
jgi:hypothetical protein